jgi:hypothetical protein
MANEVVINVRANAESAKKGLAGIADKMKGVGRGMTVMGGAITGIGIASVATFAKMGDEVQKMALRTGFSTETLSELRHAAELSGTSLQGLETGLRRMSKVIVDANDGMAESKDALDRMGVSTDELIGKSPEKQFEILTMGLANMKDETMRMATAQEVFGRAGTQLLPMLAGGAEGLAAMRKQAHELGVVFDQEAANRAADFNDSLTNLKGSMQGVAISIGGVLAPLLTDLADKMMGFVTKVSGWMKKNQGLTQTLVIVASAIGGILLVLGPLLLMLPGIIAIAPLVGAAFHIMLGPVGLITGAIALLIAGIVALKMAWDNNLGGMRDTAATILEGIIQMFVHFMRDLAPPFDILIETMNQLTGTEFPTLSEQLDKLSDITIDFSRNIETAMERGHLQTDKATDAVAELGDEIVDVSNIINKKFAPAIDNALTPFEKLVQRMQETGNIITEDMIGAANHLVDTFGIDMDEAIGRVSDALHNDFNARIDEATMKVLGLRDTIESIGGGGGGAKAPYDARNTAFGRGFGMWSPETSIMLSQMENAGDWVALMVERANLGGKWNQSTGEVSEPWSIVATVDGDGADKASGNAATKNNSMNG